LIFGIEVGIGDRYGAKEIGENQKFKMASFSIDDKMTILPFLSPC
jgi:hypothetical protein